MKVTKNLFITLLTSCCWLPFTGAAQTWVKIPDAAFTTYLRNTVPGAMQGDSLNTSSPLVTTSTHTLNVSSLSISDLSGIQYFTSLTYLNCNNNNLKTLPILPNALTYLDCGYNPSLKNILAFPNSLQTIWCQYDSLTVLPALPISLQTLLCNNNFLTSLPALPSGLQVLYCFSNALTSLPTLNNSLSQLYCYSNNITAFPVVNNSLLYLDCHSNAITSFPSLGTSLTTLYSSNNSLTNLPALPASLTILDCSYNYLNNLPALPSVLNYLDCSYNYLTSLPALPALNEFYCDSNNISCFPVFPNSIQSPVYSTCIRQWIYYIKIGSNPFTCVPNYVDAMGPDTVNYAKCVAGNTNGCAVAAGINKVADLDNLIRIYPNPASENFEIAYKVNNEELDLAIHDVTGKLVLTQAATNNSNVDVSSLPEGVYNVTIKTKAGLLNKRIIIAR